MKRKQCHIISVGNSIITNYQKKGEDKFIKDLKTADPAWAQLLDDKTFLDRIFSFLNENPRERSAEINSFTGYCEKKKVNPSDCLVYLSGTKTPINEIAVRTLERYFKDKVSLLTPKEVSGYFLEKEIDESIAVDEFKKGISELLDTLLRIAMKKKKEGYEVVFNPTGGMKPHVITCALAGFMTGSEIYYIHEEFEKNDIVILPPLLYLPRGKEILLLRKLKNGEPVSGEEYEELKREYSDELSRLDTYGLVEIERDDRSGRDFRVKITSKGKFIIGLYGWNEGV